MTQNPKAAPGKYAGYWKIKKVRRALRNGLSRALAGPRAAPAPLTPLDPGAVRRVMVCRLNKRLGNMLFLTPLLRSLADTLPQAEIDVLVRDPAHADLFRSLPGVRSIWCLPRGGWSWPFRILRFFWQLRARRYDLAVEPSLNSFSNRLVASLCGARWRLGFHTPNQWLRLTHTVMPDHREKHEVLKPLQLVSHAFPPGTARLFPRMDLGLSAAELAAGRRLRDEALARAMVDGPVLGFFTEATGKKRLPPEWWRALLAALQRSGQPLRLLQVLPPGGVPLAPGLATACAPQHRQLAALLAGLDLFVSCDAGPMHVASASGVPTVGMFNATRSYRYRPLGEKSLTLEIKDMTPGQVAQAILQHLGKLAAS